MNIHFPFDVNLGVQSFDTSPHWFLFVPRQLQTLLKNQIMERTFSSGRRRNSELGVPYFKNSPFGYGSIPINTIFRGMNIHLPAILMFTRGTIGFDPSPFGKAQRTRQRWEAGRILWCDLHRPARFRSCCCPWIYRHMAEIGARKSWARLRKT